MYYNRKDRKKLAKQLGLINNETPEKRTERVSRAINAGKQINQQFLMQVENDIRNQISEKEAEVLKSLTEKLGPEEAERIVTNNKMLENKRKEKLYNKRNK